MNNTNQLSGIEKINLTTLLTNTVLSMLKDEIFSELSKLTDNQVSSCTMLKSAKYVCALRKSIRENINLLK